AAGPPPKNGLPPAHTYKGWEERRQGRFRRKVRPQGPTTWSLSPPATQLAAPQPPAASPSPCPESIMSRLRRDAAAHAVKVRVSSQGTVVRVITSVGDRGDRFTFSWRCAMSAADRVIGGAAGATVVVLAGVAGRDQAAVRTARRGTSDR